MNINKHLRTKKIDYAIKMDPKRTQNRLKK